MFLSNPLQFGASTPKAWQILIVSLGLAVIALVTAADVLYDLEEGASWTHLSFEFVTIIICGALSIWMLKQIKLLRTEVVRYQSEANSKSLEASHWRSEAEVHVRGVGEAIEKQLKVWHLTPSEQEVVFFMLKGLAYKDIAAIRSVSEKTVRQQALAVFRKSNLGGRSELSAYFLEDLLPAQRTVGIPPNPTSPT